MPDDSNKSRILVDLPKNYTPKRTTAAVCRERLNKIKSLTYMIYDPDTLLTLKQQLTDINESCRKVAPSDVGLFIRRRTKQKDDNKKSVYANLRIPKQKKSKLTGRVGRSTNNKKKFSKINISNQFISQNDIEKLPAEEVSVNDNAMYDIRPFNPHQNSSAFPNLNSFQSSETHISLGVENIVGSKRTITEKESEAGEVTITKVIGNSNAPSKKTRSFNLSLYEERHISSKNMLISDLAQQLLDKQFPDFTGFGDIALTERNGFDVINTTKPFIRNFPYRVCLLDMCCKPKSKQSSQ